MNSHDIDSILQEYASQYPPLLTPVQAAKIAQRPVGTIYDWSSQGHFDDFKKSMGREIRLLRAPFVRWLMRDNDTASAADTKATR